MRTFVALFALAAFALVQSELICTVPDCSIASIRSTFWPHPDPSSYYSCAYHLDKGWTAVEVTCPCDTFFSYALQVCKIPTESWTFWCSSTDRNAKPEPCKCCPFH